MHNQAVANNKRESSPPWLTGLINDKKPSTFPIHYANTKSKQIRFSPPIYPGQQVRLPPSLDVKTITGPVYILNVPFLASEQLSRDANAKLINNLVKKIATQSFYDPAGLEESETIARKRVFLILGVNRPYSIDSDLNHKFVAWVEDFPKISEIKTFIVGKFWHPKMINRNEPKVFKGAKEIELEEKALKAFKLLKSKDREKAKKVKKFLYDEKCYKIKNKKQIVGKKSRIHSQIPYQQNRDGILKETFLQPWLKNAFENKHPPQVYVGIMDGDSHSFCGTEKNDIGLLRCYDEIIESKDLAPIMMSTGYSLPAGTDKISLLANIIDMELREIIAKYFPLGVYFPEPNFFLLLNELWKAKKQNEISFVGGPGNDTESRRLIENLIPNWDVSRVIFIARRCLVTTPPNRMLATPIKAESVLSNKVGDFREGFDVKDLSVEFFNSLRSVSQTHFKPKVWAANLFIGLKASQAIPCEVSKICMIHGPLMNICTVFDFPTFFNDMGFKSMLYDGKKINLSSFKEYTQELLRHRKEIVKNHQATAFSIGRVSEDYMRAKIEILKINCEKLAAFQISKKILSTILKVAAHSGESVYDTLAKNVVGLDLS